MRTGKRETQAHGDSANQAGRGNQVHEEGDLKKYRTETPNLIYELRLTPYECALYNHFKRVAGAGPNGQCYRSTDRLAEETAMSPGMISKAKQGLLRTDRPGLNGKSLIHIEKDESRPGRPRDIVTIVDIWPENFLFFVKQSSPQSSYSELQSSPQSSPGEPKNKKESKKEPSKEKQQQPLLPPQLPFGENLEATGLVAAAADSLRLEDLELEEHELATTLSPEERDARRVLTCSLHDLGVKYKEAEALVQEFPLPAIQQQIDWLPFQNCKNPGYWLPRYIREGWPKPRGLVRQEAEVAKQQAREKTGVSAAEERNQERLQRDAQAQRRQVYRSDRKSVV